MKYRPEIDGLRTIAVLSVIIYHAQIVEFGHSFFKGGFVGVDIFFVISGYLISRILLSELFEKGKISFLQFYERRASVESYPSYLSVFLASFPLAYKYLLPNQFIEYAQSILSATFFGSNIFFYFTNTQYGAEDSLLQPFLHTWSLGVEEQFYILFPIVLLLAYKFAKNHLITIIAVLILISLQYADWQSIKNTQLNFFMLTSRLWELGIGSLLAFYELKYGRVKHELLNQTMPLLGLAMITHSIIFFNNQTPHPSLITLLPTIGTALIILYSVNKTDLVGKVLSWKPIVGVGLISYSMYLWHYPLFAFARIGDSNGLHNDEKYLLILLTIVLSVISYFLIEKPFRNKQFLNGKKFSAAILILLTAVIGVNWKVIESKGFDGRVPKFLSINKDVFGKSISFSFSLNGEVCHNKIDSWCVFGENNSKHLVLYGNSIIAYLAMNLVEELSQSYKLTHLTKSGCIPTIIKTDITDKMKCDEANNLKVINKVGEDKNSVIIFGGFFDNSFSNDLQKKAIIQTINKFLDDGHKLILLYPLPPQQKNIANNIFDGIPKRNKNRMIDWLENNRFTSDFSEFKTKHLLTFKALDTIEHKNLYRIYPHKVLCNTIIEGKCVANDNQNIYYINDGIHPSYQYTLKINKLIIDKLKEINNP